MKRTLLPAAGLSYLAVFVLLGLGEVGGLHVNIPKKVLFEEILRQTRSWTRPGLFPVRRRLVFACALFEKRKRLRNNWKIAKPTTASTVRACQVGQTSLGENENL